MGPGVAQECAETRDGLTIWEDHFFPEIIDPDTGRVAARRRAGRTGAHLADQGSDAGHPLSHPRSDAAAARHGAHHAPHRAHQGPQRRHADHPRRQRLSLADRGGARPASRGSRRITCWKCAGRSNLDELDVLVEMRPEIAGKLSAEEIAALAQQGRASDQGLCRRHRDGARAGAGNDRALAGQGQARHRPAAESLKRS